MSVKKPASKANVRMSDKICLVEVPCNTARPCFYTHFLKKIPVVCLFYLLFWFIDKWREGFPLPLRWETKITIAKHLHLT